MNTSKPAAKRPPRQPKQGLVSKLIRIMLVVGTVPLSLAMIMSYMQSDKSVRGVIGGSFEALAFSSASKIELLLEKEINKIKQMARHPTLSLSLKERNRVWGGAPLEELEAESAVLAASWKAGTETAKEIARGPASRVLETFHQRAEKAGLRVAAIFVTDAQGLLVASINNYPEYNNRNRPSWRKLVQEKITPVFFGSLVRDSQVGEFLFEIAVNITNRAGEILGAFHCLYPAKEFFAASVEPIVFGDTGHVMLITSDGVVIDCPILPTGHRLENRRLVEQVTGPKAAWAETEGNGHGSQELSLIGYSPLEKYKQITQASSGLSWYTFAWQSSEELFAPTQKLFLWISTAGFVSVLLIAFMGWIAAKSIVKPIRLLQKTAASIGRGEDVPHLEIRTGDEIQLLADEINTMNSLLKKTFSGLENKVEEKTREVTYLKEYTERVLMSVPEAIVIFNNKEKIEFVNTAFEKFTGIQQKDCLGKSVREALPQFYKELDSLSKELTAYQRGGASGLANVTSNQGSTYQAQDPLRPKEKENQSEVQSTLSIGDWLLAYQFFDMVIAGDEARRTGLLMKDITDERKLLDHLVLAEKLSGLGTLAAGIAHEMNNPLFSIMGYTEAILDEKDPKEMHKYAEKVLDRSKHMASVILNFAGYSRSNARDGVAPVQLNEKLDAALDMAVLASYSDDIKVTRNYEEIPPIKAKPEEIQQIFLNLIGNAVQAMDGKGELDLTTRRYDGLMEIQIKDSGPGISPEHILKIFDPFFTTKEQGKGTGLGLNIVHRVIEKYGGNIRVESERGKGACFIITFPAKD